MKKNWWKESVVYQIYREVLRTKQRNGLSDIPGS